MEGEGGLSGSNSQTDVSSADARAKLIPLALAEIVKRLERLTEEVGSMKTALWQFVDHEKRALADLRSLLLDHLHDTHLTEASA